MLNDGMHFLPWLGSKIVVIVVVGSIFVLKKMLSNCWISTEAWMYWSFLIIADGFRDMLINSVLQS